MSRCRQRRCHHHLYGTWRYNTCSGRNTCKSVNYTNGENHQGDSGQFKLNWLIFKNNVHSHDLFFSNSLLLSSVVADLDGRRRVAVFLLRETCDHLLTFPSSFCILRSGLSCKMAHFSAPLRYSRGFGFARHLG